MGVNVSPEIQLTHVPPDRWTVSKEMSSNSRADTLEFVSNYDIISCIYRCLQWTVLATIVTVEIPLNYLKLLLSSLHKELNI